jgi:hypothetical protein
MLAKKIVNKSVSFNVLDPFQAQMLKYVEQYPNCSAYIKRLIQRDMENGTKKAPTEPNNNRISMTQLNGIKLD